MGASSDINEREQEPRKAYLENPKMEGIVFMLLFNTEYGLLSMGLSKYLASVNLDV